MTKRKTHPTQPARVSNRLTTAAAIATLLLAAHLCSNTSGPTPKETQNQTTTNKKNDNPGKKEVFLTPKTTNKRQTDNAGTGETGAWKEGDGGKVAWENGKEKKRVGKLLGF